MNNARFTRILMAIFTILCALRALGLGPVALDVDEAWFAVSAHGLESPFRFYEQALDNKPPGTVWFYSLVQWAAGSGPDPRWTRAVVHLGMIVAALFTASMAAPLTSVRNRARRPWWKLDGRAWVVAVLMLACCTIPVPEMLAGTTEGLALPLLCGVFAVIFHALNGNLWARRRIVWLSAGLATGCALLLKQTVVLVLPALALGVCLALARRHMSFSALAAYGLGLCVISALVLFGIGPRTLWYWNIEYPALVLAKARESSFATIPTLVVRISLYFGLLFPVLFGGGLHLFRRIADVGALGVALAWLACSACVILVGKGLFYHYFLLLAPPLALLAGSSLAGTRSFKAILRSLRLPIGASVLVCGIAAWPSLGVVWGTDLNYYERVGQAIGRWARPEARVFVWGGNALALAYSGHRHATRFVTARLAASQYATPQTSALFEQEFFEAPPDLFVDLHERGDERFHLPPCSLDWLCAMLRVNYRLVREPTLPWVSFYVRQSKAESGRAVAGRLPDPKTAPPVSWPPIPDKPGVSIFELITEARAWPHLLAYERLVRALDALERFAVAANANIDATPELSDYRRALKRALLRQKRMIHGRQPQSAALAAHDSEHAKKALQWVRERSEALAIESPLSADGPGWWASVAMVKLQPR